MLRIYFLVLTLGLCWSLNIDSVLNVDVLTGTKKDGSNSMNQPCPNLSANCVTKALAERSTCTPVTEPKIGGIHLAQVELSLPHANATFVWDNAEITGLDNSKIAKFYINNNTKKIVLEVIFEELTIKGDSHFLFFLKGREPETLSSFFSFTYKKASVTATIPYDPNYGIFWQRMHAFTYVEIGNTPYIAGPGLITTDPEVKASVDEVFAQINLGLKEVSLQYGKFVFKTYLNNYLCKI